MIFPTIALFIDIMKKIIFILIPAVMILAACGEDDTPRESIQSLETAPPHTVTRSTYTGTTVDFIAASTTAAPRMGSDDNGYDVETGDTADGNYGYTETGAAADGFDSPETVTGDTSEGRAAAAPETAGENDGFIDTYHDTMDTADNEILSENLFYDTDDTSDRRYD